MTPSRLTDVQHALLFGVLRNASPNDVLTAIASFYDGAMCVHQAHARHEAAEECHVARNGIEVVLSQLSELAAANDRASAELIDQLERSIAATAPKVA